MVGEIVKVPSKAFNMLKEMDNSTRNVLIIVGGIVIIQSMKYSYELSLNLTKKEFWFGPSRGTSNEERLAVAS